MLFYHIVAIIFFFLHTRSLLVPLAYACFKSIDCILLSSLELKSILLIYSVKIFCVSLLNLCCVFNISSLFLMNSSELSTSVLFLSKYFILFSISAASNQFLQSCNLSFLFMTQFFVPFACLPLSLLSFKQLYVFALYPTNSFMICSLIYLSLFQSLFYFFLQIMVYLFQYLKSQILFQRLPQYLCQYHAFKPTMTLSLSI